MKTEINNQTPLYEHDCNDCIYLGRNNYQPLSWMEEKVADVYYCTNTQNHISEKSCISVRWQQGPQGFSSFPYSTFYLLRYKTETEGQYTLMKPYIWGLEQAQNRGLIKNENKK